MDTVKCAVTAFTKLFDYNYQFVISCQKKPHNQDTYCICSFFIEPETEYKGIKAYWLYKSKINLLANAETVLYNRLQENNPTEKSKTLKE